MNEFKDKKITKTSFLDDSFRKNLESALRFGNPLLVQDVENYDPILNPVLNRELRRTGGRVLITLGDQVGYSHDSRFNIISKKNAFQLKSLLFSYYFSSSSVFYLFKYQIWW